MSDCHLHAAPVVCCFAFVCSGPLVCVGVNAAEEAQRGPGVERGPHDVLAVSSACPWATGIKNVRARSSDPPPVDRTGARSTVGMPHDPVSFHHAWLSAGGLKLGSLSSPWCRPWWPAGTRSTPAHRHAVGTSLRPPATFGSTASASSCSASSGTPHGARPCFASRQRGAERRSQRGPRDRHATRCWLLMMLKADAGRTTASLELSGLTEHVGTPLWQDANL